MFNHISGSPLFSDHRDRLRQILSTLVVCCSVLLLQGCDSSEDDNLLNPPQADSTYVRVLNLLPDGSLDFRFDDQQVAQTLGRNNVNTYQPLFFRELVTLTIGVNGNVDTVFEGQSLPSSTSGSYRATYVVYGNAGSRKILSLVQTPEEKSLMTTTGQGRLYFINALEGDSAYLKKGCLGGDTLFRPISGQNYAGSVELNAGEYSFYLFQSDRTSELASARMSIGAGDAILLVATSINGRPGLYRLDISSGDMTSGQILPTEPETRTTAKVRVLNGLDGSSLSAELLGSNSNLVRDLASFSLSPLMDIEICTDPNGDSLQVVVDGSDTVAVPLKVEVGAAATLAVYRNGNDVAARVIPTTGAEPGNNEILLRGINLTSNRTSMSISVGAGAPVGTIPGSRLFANLLPGTVTPYRTLQSGIYPLWIETTNGGRFIDGGIHSFGRGTYSIVLLDQNDSVKLFFLDESGGSADLATFEISGKRSYFFNMVPNVMSRFTLSTSLGTIEIDSIAYSYVNPTILPIGTTQVSAEGGGSRSVTVTEQGYTIGTTGEASGIEMVAFERPSVSAGSGKSFVRFLNAVPGFSEMDIHQDKVDGQVLTTAVYGLPSQEVERDARRYTFSVSRRGTNDELARITGVELSEGRNYLLIVGPKGSGGTSSLPYSTIWMEE